MKCGLKQFVTVLASQRFFLEITKSGEGGRRTGGMGEGLRPPSLFVFCRVALLVFLGGRGGDGK